VIGELEVHPSSYQGRAARYTETKVFMLKISVVNCLRTKSTAHMNKIKIFFKKEQKVLSVLLMRENSS
jgi:hypothetical protein